MTVLKCNSTLSPHLTQIKSSDNHNPKIQNAYSLSTLDTEDTLSDFGKQIPVFFSRVFLPPSCWMMSLGLQNEFSSEISYHSSLASHPCTVSSEQGSVVSTFLESASGPHPWVPWVLHSLLSRTFAILMHSPGKDKIS